MAEPITDGVLRFTRSERERIMEALAHQAGVLQEIIGRLERIEAFCVKAEAAYESSPARKLARRLSGGHG
jgi:hypothetical protein